MPVLLEEFLRTRTLRTAGRKILVARQTWNTVGPNAIFGFPQLVATMTESLAELQVQYQDFLQGEVRCESVRLWLRW